MNSFTPTSRTTLKRLPTRGAYDKPTVHAILDETFLCHVGFVAGGQPYVIPTSYGRAGDTIYIHGASTSRLLQSLAEGIPVCVTVTLTDGLVLARSAFHHSINYRSVVMLGKARLLDDPAEKMKALEIITDHVIPGRWAEVRPPNEQELKATAVLALPLEEVSAKIRTGPPIDDKEDLSWPVWAGVLPLSVVPGQPVTDSLVPPGLALSTSVKNYRKKQGADR